MTVMAASIISGTLILIGTVITVAIGRITARDQVLLEMYKETRGRVDRLEARERVRDDYIIELRQHIEEDKGPPPPPYPEGLRL